MGTLGEYIADEYEKELNDILGDAADPIDTSVAVLRWFDKNQEALRFLSGHGHKKVTDWYTIIFKQQQILKDYANIERGINNMAKSMHPGFYKRLGIAQDIHCKTMSKVYDESFETLRADYDDLMDTWHKTQLIRDRVENLWKNKAYNEIKYMFANRDILRSIVDPHYSDMCESMVETILNLMRQDDNLAIHKEHRHLLTGMLENLWEIHQNIDALLLVFWYTCGDKPIFRD